MRTDLRTGFQANDYFQKYCFVCDREADAEWHGKRYNVAVCASCAVSIIPWLIAEAATKHGQRIREILEKVQASFYQGAALALERDCDDGKTELHTNLI